LSFVVKTNLSSSVRLGAQESDVLFVGGFLGDAAAGIYKVAKSFGSIPTRLGAPIQDSIYPEMARLWAAGCAAEFRAYVFRFGLFAGLVGLAISLLFLLEGQQILTFLVGPDFGSAVAPLNIYMTACVLYLFGVALRPAMLSMERPGRILLIYVGAHLIYFPTLLALLPRLGVLGAAIAQLVFHGVWFVAMSSSVATLLGRSLETQPARLDP
jgi:O-antigen/teichoic acid export membrane protein